MLYEVHLYFKDRDGSLTGEGNTRHFLAKDSRDARNQMLVKCASTVAFAGKYGYVFFVKEYDRYED